MVVKKTIGQRHLARGIWDEACGGRHQGGGIWEEAPERKHLRGSIWGAMGMLWDGGGLGGWGRPGVPDAIVCKITQNHCVLQCLSY